MKIALFGPINSIHLQRWVESLHRRGLEVGVATQHESTEWSIPQGVTLLRLPHSGEIGYLLNAITLRRWLQQHQPALLNAHYASGYGTTAALAGYQPTLLSVWGSDVFDFPYESWWRRLLINWNLRRATRIASTSEVMARQVAALVPDLPPAFITPFGVDCEQFAPSDSRDSSCITIGTVKTLAPKYGIDVLIRAFALLIRDARIAELDSRQPLRLLLVGGGPDRAALQSLAYELNVTARVEFAGQVLHNEVPQWLQKLDIYVAASRSDSESFGVAAVEASACGVPVVVSDAGGLPEVVLNGKTGLVVPRDNPKALAESLLQLVLNPAQRAAFGEAGRKHVLEHYEWGRCVDKMVDAYMSTVSETRK